MFTLTIDEITMNFQTIFVTHVEVSPHHFIKIHGQTNREMASEIDSAMPTMINIFSTYPSPDLHMLHAECKVLVYYSTHYYRGKFITSDVRETANILLIDLGYTVNIELANVRQTEIVIQVSAILWIFTFTGTRTRTNESVSIFRKFAGTGE